MDYLLKSGWVAVSLSGLLNEPVRNDKAFAVTFDDAYASVYKQAFPILRSRNIPATVFAVTGCVGGTNTWDTEKGDVQEQLMTLDELRELSANGFQIGSHTLTHPHLTALSAPELQDEIVSSKHWLEDALGKQVTGFSYPFGEVDSRVRQAVIDAGYQYACGVKLGVVTQGVDVFDFPRVNVRWMAVGPLLARKIRRARDVG